MAKRTYDEHGIPVRPDPEFGKQVNVRVDDAMKPVLHRLLAALKRRGVLNPSATDVVVFGLIQGDIHVTGDGESQSNHVVQPAPETPARNDETPKPPKRKGGKA